MDSKPDDRLKLLNDSSVNFVRFSIASVDINFFGGKNREKKYADLQIEADFTLEANDQKHTIQPGEKETLAPVIDLIGATVTNVEYIDGDILSFSFDNDYHLTVKPIPKYEAWTLTGDDLGFYVQVGV